MLAAGIKTPVPLEALGIHLREDIAQQAFKIAVQKIGQSIVLKNELKKVERNQMKQAIIISAGVIGILAGMAFVLPAVAEYKHEGAMTLNVICLLLSGFGFVLGGGSVAVFTFRKRKV